MSKQVGLGYVLAVAGLVASGWLAAGWLYYSPRLELAAQAVEAARGEAARQRESARACTDRVDQQNSALEDLRGRLAASEDQAAHARREAVLEREKHDRLAQEVMSEATPPGADACDAASAAFDAELRRERGLR